MYIRSTVDVRVPKDQNGLYKGLLGGLLLLLFLLATCILSGLLCGFFCLLLLATAGNEKSNNSLRFNETVVIDLEFAEDVVDLGLGELVTEVHQSVTEHLSLNKALLALLLDLVSLEGTDDQVIGIVGATSHLFLEHLHHAVVRAGSTNLCQHGVEFRLVHKLANIVKGGTG